MGHMILWCLAMKVNLNNLNIKFQKKNLMVGSFDVMVLGHGVSLNNSNIKLSFWIWVIWLKTKSHQLFKTT